MQPLLVCNERSINSTTVNSFDMKKSDFFFNLPEELIAQEPLCDRSSSRLMCLDKSSGEIDSKRYKGDPCKTVR